MRRILAIQVVNDMWQRDSMVPVSQGFRGKVDSMGLTRAEVSLGGRDLSWTSRVRKLVKRHRERIRALKIGEPHELSITRARESTSSKTVTTQIGGDRGT